MRYLARELDTARLLLIGAYRTVDPLAGQPLADMAAEVAREPHARRLSLSGLSESEVADYLQLTGSSPQLAVALHEQTDGNPLFVGEIVRLLSVEGAPPSVLTGPGSRSPRVSAM